MLSIITDEFVEKKHWITNDEMLDMIAISESIPGAIAINTSIAVGYKIRGLKGAIAAVLGVVCPSILVITVVTYFYNSLPKDSPAWLFIKGVRAGVVGLMLAVILKLGKKIVGDKFSGIVFAVGFTLAVVTDVPVILFVLSGAIIGYIHAKVAKHDIV